MLNLSEKTLLSVYFPMESMTDPDSQRTKRMPQFYFQDLTDETASRRQFVDLLFIDYDFECSICRQNATLIWGVLVFTILKYWDVFEVFGFYILEF